MRTKMEGTADNPMETASSIETVAAGTPSSFRDRMPRIYELKDIVAEPSHPDACFRNIEDGLDSSSSKLNAYLKLERQLQALGADSWADLRERAALFMQKRHPGRGWQELFNIFSEARAFGYLGGIGCTDVRFIKRAEGKTPNIAAMRGGSPVFCEVKTINISDDEVRRRQRVVDVGFAASETSVHLSEKFLNKLSSTLEGAVEQLDAADPERKAQRFVFVVVHFDDWVGDYQAEYFAEIDAHLLQNPVAESELVFCPASNLFERTFSMRSATVLPE